jgi:hypothetical protein
LDRRQLETDAALQRESPQQIVLTDDTASGIN